MEARLIPKAGYPFAPIEVAGIQRKLTLENIGRNFSALCLLAKSGPRAASIIKGFGPDVVMGTGGYVSGPIVRKAHQLGCKTITHEQNAFPGVTTKLLAPDVDRLLLAMEGAAKHLHLKDPDKLRVTGNPVPGGDLLGRPRGFADASRSGRPHLHPLVRRKPRRDADQ